LKIKSGAEQVFIRKVAAAPAVPAAEGEALPEEVEVEGEDLTEAKEGEDVATEDTETEK